MNFGNGLSLLHTSRFLLSPFAFWIPPATNVLESPGLSRKNTNILLRLGNPGMTFVRLAPSSALLGLSYASPQNIALYDRLALFHVSPGGLISHPGWKNASRVAIVRSFSSKRKGYRNERSLLGSDSGSCLGSRRSFCRPSPKQKDKASRC